MAARRESGRALWVLSGLGIAAVVATLVLLLTIEQRVIAEQKARGRESAVGNARDRCDLLKSVLVSRLKRLVEGHPDASSLFQIADAIREEFHDFSTLKETGQGIHVLIVDERLQPIWPIPREGDRDLRPCARHILEDQDSVFLLPRGCETTGEPPECLCYTCPLRRGGQLLGGIVIHKEMDDPVGNVFASLDRMMTVAIIATQLVLLLALGAIACLAHRAIAAAEQRRAEDERLAAVGNLAAGVAHEIRNPLNTIALTCRYLERLISKGEPTPALRGEANTNFEIIASELARLTRTLDDFVLLAKPTDLALVDCDAESILDDALALFAREFEDAKIHVVLQRAGSLPVAADRGRLAQVFANIIRNGIQAMPSGGTLSVTSQQADGCARVAFADTGPGFNAADFHRVFEPYYSTKRSGLGLGLALSLRIVESQGGTIEVSNQPTGGALVAVSLPIRPAAAEARHAP
jgi:signal transduction histidine kinase